MNIIVKLILYSYRLLTYGYDCKAKLTDISTGMPLVKHLLYYFIALFIGELLVGA